ncbi:hypothetical protein ACS8YF_02260 [Salinisphaera sp. SWV1]|uniref:hypothetical protein n=1 Tax=Salinisphaera sp. SWV1 TaxID=3454139 RepID=UPI003F8486CA
MQKKILKILTIAIFFCIPITFFGCEKYDAVTAPPVNPPLYLEIGKQTSPLFGPGGFTQARKSQSKSSKTYGNGKEAGRPNSPKSESAASVSPGP